MSIPAEDRSVRSKSLKLQEREGVIDGAYLPPSKRQGVVPGTQVKRLASKMDSWNLRYRETLKVVSRSVMSDSLQPHGW